MIVRRLPRRARAVVLAIAVAALVAGFAPAATAAPPAHLLAAQCPAPTTSPGPSGGIDLSATILGPDACPTTPPVGGGPGLDAQPGAGGGAPSGSRTGSGGTGSSPAGDPPSSVAPPADAPAPASDEIELGGILHVGGLTTHNVPSLDPFGGSLQVWFTVRNVSQSTISASAEFWMQGPFGNRISSVSGVGVDDLKPGETRTISAELPGVGQWTILTAYATFTPPAEVDGTELSPLTRDATAFALPWLLALLIALGLGAWVVVQVQRRAVSAELAGAPA